MEDNYDVIKLADDTKWFVISKTTYNNNLYQLVIQTNDNDDFFLETARIFQDYEKDGITYTHFVTDENLIKELMPQLVPQIKHYLDNPTEVINALESALN